MALPADPPLTEPAPTAVGHTMATYEERDAYVAYRAAAKALLAAEEARREAQSAYLQAATRLNEAIEAAAKPR